MEPLEPVCLPVGFSGPATYEELTSKDLVFKKTTKEFYGYETLFLADLENWSLLAQINFWFIKSTLKTIQYVNKYY